MVVTLGQQYNVVIVVSHIQCIGCQPGNNYFTRVANDKCFRLRGRIDIARANQKPLFT